MCVGGKWVWELSTSCSICCESETTLKHKVSKEFKNHTHLPILKSLPTIKFHDFMTSSRYFDTLKADTS